MRRDRLMSENAVQDGWVWSSLGPKLCTPVLHRSPHLVTIQPDRLDFVNRGLFDIEALNEYWATHAHEFEKVLFTQTFAAVVPPNQESLVLTPLPMHQDYWGSASSAIREQRINDCFNRPSAYDEASDAAALLNSTGLAFLSTHPALQERVNTVTTDSIFAEPPLQIVNAIVEFTAQLSDSMTTSLRRALKEALPSAASVELTFQHEMRATVRLTFRPNPTWRLVPSCMVELISERPWADAARQLARACIVRKHHHLWLDAIDEMRRAIHGGLKASSIAEATMETTRLVLHWNDIVHADSSRTFHEQWTSNAVQWGRIKTADDVFEYHMHEDVQGERGCADAHPLQAPSDGGVLAVATNWDPNAVRQSLTQTKFAGVPASGGQGSGVRFDVETNPIDGSTRVAPSVAGAGYVINDVLSAQSIVDESSSVAPGPTVTVLKVSTQSRPMLDSLFPSIPDEMMQVQELVERCAKDPLRLANAFLKEVCPPWKFIPRMASTSRFVGPNASQIEQAQWVQLAADWACSVLNIQCLDWRVDRHDPARYPYWDNASSL